MTRVGWVAAAFGVASLVGGCGGGRGVDEFLRHHGFGGDHGGGQGGGGQGGNGAGSGGSAGSGGPQTCGPGQPLLGAGLQVAAAPAGQLYVRCGTLGQEGGGKAVLSPDAGRLAVSTTAGTVRLIDTSAWRQIAQLAPPVGVIDAMAFSPDGATLATLSAEMGEVVLWSAADGTLQRRFAGPPASPFDGLGGTLAFSPDGRRLATSLQTVIDLPSGTTTSWSAIENAAPPIIVELAFLPDGNRLYVRDRFQVGNSPPTALIELLDLTAATATVLFQRFEQELAGAALSPDRRRVAIGQPVPVPSLVLYDTSNGQVIAQDGSLTSAGRVLAFSPDSTRLYTQDTPSAASLEAQVRDAVTLSVTSRFPLPADAAFAAVSPGDALIFNVTNGSVWFASSTGQVARQTAYPVIAPGWSSDARFGAATGGDALFRLWREADATLLCSPPGASASATVTALALSSSGDSLALAHASGSIQLYPVPPSGVPGAAAATVAGGVTSTVFHTTLVAVSNGGGRVAMQGPPLANSAADNVRLEVRETATGALLRSDDSSVFTGLALSGDGRWVAFNFGSFDAPAIHVMSIADGSTVLSLPVGDVFLHIVSFSPDSTRLAVSTNDGIQVWRVPEGTLDTTYTLPGVRLQDPRLSPDWSLAAADAVSGVEVTTETPTVWRPADQTVVTRLAPNRVIGPSFDARDLLVGFSVFLGHAHATDIYRWTVYEVATGAELRQFPFIAPGLLPPGGATIVTAQGSGAAVWCRSSRASLTTWYSCQAQFLGH